MRDAIDALLLAGIISKIDLISEDSEGSHVRR
jgi:hypothetical protein